MATQGPNFPGSANQTAFGLETSWVSPSNVTVEDGNYVTCEAPFTGGSSEHLLATGFQFNIPDGATDIRLLVEAKLKANVDNIFSIERVALRYSGNERGTAKAPNTPITTNEGYLTFGGELDDWSASLTAAVLNDSSFGVGLALGCNGAMPGEAIASLDAIRVTAYYTPPNTAPAAINDLAATPGSGKLTFTWSAPSDGGAAITKYSLYLSNGVVNSLYQDNVTSGVEISGLQGGTSSGPWTVTATNSVGESALSNAVTATPGATVPAAIADLSATPGYNSLTFNFSAPNDGGASISGYSLYRDSSFYQSITNGQTVSPLAGGSPVGVWTVRATNLAGEGPDSNGVTATPLVVTPPDAVSDLAVGFGPSQGQLQFTWSPPATHGADVTGYDLYLNGFLQVSSATSPQIVGSLPPNTTLEFWTIKANSSAGDSAASNAVSAYVPGPPLDVTDLAAVPHATSVDLSWTDNSLTESNYYVVKRLHGETDWETIADLVPDSEDYTASGLTTNTAYDFGVYGSGIYGVGNIVVIENVSTITPTAPSAIDDLAAEAGDTEITLTWSAPADGGAEITQYNIYLDSELLDEDVASPLTLTGLPNDVEAGPYTITAVNSVGESDPSNEVSATPTSGEDPPDPDPPRSNDELNLTADEWVEYAQGFDRMQLDGGNGKIHLPCYDQDFIASIEAVLPPEILSRVVFGSRGGRGCVG